MEQSNVDNVWNYAKIFRKSYGEHNLYPSHIDCLYMCHGHHFSVYTRAFTLYYIDKQIMGQGRQYIYIPETVLVLRLVFIASLMKYCFFIYLYVLFTKIILNKRFHSYL